MRFLARLIPIALVNFKIKYDPAHVDAVLWVKALNKAGYDVKIVLEKE